MTRLTDAVRPPRSYRDLMTATGLGRETVKALIRSGELPGFHVGRSYVVPADAFDDFCKGTWVARPRPQRHEPVKPLALIHRKQSA